MLLSAVSRIQNVPYRRIYLQTWFPTGEAVWKSVEPFRGGAWLKNGCTWPFCSLPGGGGHMSLGLLPPHLPRQGGLHLLQYIIE